MLDIRFIRENADLVAEKSKQKGYAVDISRLLELDEQRRQIMGDIEMVRAERNKLVAEAKGQKPSEESVQRGQHIKQHLSDCEERLKPIEDEFNQLLAAVPNVTPDDTPLGGEADNVEVKKWPAETSNEVLAGKGEIKDHLAWGEERGLIDFERGAKVA